MGMIRLSVPAKRDYLHVVRSVVGGVAAKASMVIDDVEDLRLAVDEACAHLMSVAAGASTLTIEVGYDDDLIEVFAGVDAHVNGKGSQGPGAHLAWQILGALTDSAVMQPAPGGGAGIRMTKQVLR